jgi:hypothetical protein
MSIEAYLTKSIKDIITEFPEIKQILDEYSIGCGASGTVLCLLKDIVETHKIIEDLESELMARLPN